MFWSLILAGIIIVVYLVVAIQRNRKERQLETEEQNRKALLEAILENSKDRYTEN